MKRRGITLANINSSKDNENMKEKEILLMDHGRFHPSRDLPGFLSLLVKEKANIRFVLSEYLSARTQTKSQNVKVSYFFSVTDPLNLFKTTFDHLKRNYPDIANYEIESKNRQVTIRVYLKEANWDLEEMIYDFYGRMLDKFRTQDFSLEVAELVNK